MSSPGSPFGELSSSLDRELVAGEIWTFKQDGEFWPVVICDEALLMTLYRDRLRPFSSRKADGTWPEGYKSGENCVNSRQYPTVILGKLKFIFIVRTRLNPFENDLAQAIWETTSNPILAQAYREAFRFSALDDPLPDVKKAIHQLRLGRGHPKGPIGSDDIANIKRKGTPLSKCSQSMEVCDDEEPEAWFVRQGSSTGHTIKKEASESGFAIDMNAGDGFAGDGFTDVRTSAPEQPQKKSRLDSLGRSSMRTSTPLRAGIQNLTLERVSMSRATPASSVNEVVDNPELVTIYVGNPHIKFLTKRSGLAASPLLSKMVSHHPNHGWYVMAPILSQITKDEFFPVGQYLERGEYDPNIVDEGTDWVRLVPEVSGIEAGPEVIRCATIYDIAGKLEIAGLLDLAFRKLKALTKDQPHQPHAILCAVDIVFKSATPDMKQYLVEYLAENFWDLMMEEHRLLAEIMQGNDELRKMVFKIMAGLPEAQDEIDHATVATAAGDNLPEDHVITNDFDEINALDDEIAAHEVAATLPYPLPAVLHADIDEQMREDLGGSYEGVMQVIEDLKDDAEQVNGEEDARMLEG